ncbi:RsmD family RNA methyltransferase [Mesoplasma photuris]|uniref:RsmD family RNA methyltransferase n=1 Tax=Mesoplasma photuris TaxID=217731 RepID=UPI0004E105F9|nr:RsmD family RNA methyltransferase [Mesoplasma photuris]
MQVISGKYGGRKLIALEGMNTRPTSARVKEDMFNILNNYFIWDNKTSLDLFGGSGALSIEGISRGIKHAYINDHYHPAMEIIKQNLKGIDKTSYTLYEKDYADLLEIFKLKNISVDLIYLDPPFPKIEYYYDFFNKISQYNILNNWGIILTEAPELLNLDQISGLTLLKYKDLKNKHLYVFRLERE